VATGSARGVGAGSPSDGVSVTATAFVAGGAAACDGCVSGTSLDDLADWAARRAGQAADDAACGDRRFLAELALLLVVTLDDDALDRSGRRGRIEQGLFRLHGLDRRGFRRRLSQSGRLRRGEIGNGLGGDRERRGQRATDGQRQDMTHGKLLRADPR
jgi:hypothetical protein